MVEHLPKALYRLRWKFVFADKPSTVGPWNLGTEHPANKACNVDKAGLIWAIIEGEHVETFEIVQFYACTGDNYVSCMGEAYVRIPRGGIGIQGPAIPRVHLSGISFITREKKVMVNVNGLMTERELTESEKQFDMYEHKLGSGLL